MESAGSRRTALFTCYWHLPFFQLQILGYTEAGSELVETEQGVIEFSRIGEQGPTILVLHGTPGGYDQGMIIGDRLESSGFSFWRYPGPAICAHQAAQERPLMRKVAPIWHLWMH